MTDLSRMFREERFDITDAYTESSKDFDSNTFARSILALIMEDYDDLSNLMRVEHAPLLTPNDVKIDADNVLSVELVDVKSTENVAVVTLKQKGTRGENKKLIVSGELTPLEFRTFSAMQEKEPVASNETTNDQYAKVREGGYELIEDLETYENKIADSKVTTVFGPVGEFGRDLIRFHQVDADGKVVYRGFVDYVRTEDAFAQAKADQAYFAAHGSLEVA